MAEDRKEYNFKCGIKAYQEECTLEQDKKLLKVLSKIEFKDINDLRNMRIGDIVNTIIDKDIIGEIFFTILILDADNIKVPFPGWDSLKRSEVAEVIEDFFTLSPVLTKWFGNGNFAQVLKSASL